jgi:GT2 family glycosyltransferase
MDRGAPDMRDIAFVILTWNSETYIERCLESIVDRCAADHLDFEIFVVDNGSSDATASAVRACGERWAGRVTLIALDGNRGTTFPRNLALRQAHAATICVVDSDTEFRSGSIRPIVRLLESDPTLGLVAPRLLLPDGSVQHSVKRFPTFLNKLRKIPQILMRRPAPRPDFYSPYPFERCTFVDTAISACWFLRRDVIDAVGLLDEGIFYAPEDVEYCARLREAGKRIVYFPYLTLLHHTQQISHRRPLSVMSLSHLKGLGRYHRRHGGWLASQGSGPQPAADLDEAARRWIQADSGPTT